VEEVRADMSDSRLNGREKLSSACVPPWGCYSAIVSATIA
jgi:hypothetical protein